MTDKKNKTELWKFYLNGDLEKLNVDELKELQALIEKHGAIKKETKVEIVEKIVEPESKIEMESETKYTNDGEAKFSSWFNNYKEAQTDDNKSMLGFFDPYFKNTDSDTGCEDIVSDWSPADNYAKQVWATSVCESNLLQVCVKNLQISGGDGLGVQIKLAGKIAAPTEKNACECNSCCSITFTTYPLTIKQLGLESVTCKLNEFDVGGDLMTSYITAMKNSWKEYFDATIYSELTSAVEGTTETLPAALVCDPALSGSCCSDASLLNMWNAVNAGIANMREGVGLKMPYNPTHIIISPSVAKIFKRMQTPTTQFYKDVVFDSMGRISSICGLTCIEYCGATTCSNDSGAVMAVIVDSSRACGCVFGEKPHLYKFFQSNCNSVRLDMWSFVAIAELDCDAICHIKNP